MQRLPGAPTQTSRLFGLHVKAADLKQKAADMEAKAVPRPDPPQYGPLWQNVHRFLNGLGIQERMTDLLGRLTVSKSWHLVVCDIIRCICPCSFALALPVCSGVHIYICTICDDEVRLTEQTPCPDSLLWFVGNRHEQQMSDEDVIP